MPSFRLRYEISIDYVTKPWYELAHPRSWRGVFQRRSCRRSGEWRPAAAARNRGLGRSGTPPARHYDLAARSRCTDPGGNAGDGSAAPGRKSPRWSAERRASRVMGRAAPRRLRSRRASQARQRNSAPVGAPPAPRSGTMRSDQGQTRARERAAGTKNTALFDIVNLAKEKDARRRHGAPIVSRASAARPGTQGDTSGPRSRIRAWVHAVGFTRLRAFTRRSRACPRSVSRSRSSLHLARDTRLRRLHRSFGWWAKRTHGWYAVRLRRPALA